MPFINSMKFNQFLQIFRKFFLLISCVLFLSSCFSFGKVEKVGSIRGYNDGVVITHGGRFRVGKLPDHWVLKETEKNLLLFKNVYDASTISVSSWCRGAVDDGSVESLTRQLLAGLTKVKVLNQNKIPLANRYALMTEAYGVLDTRNVFFKTYVLSKHSCVFDFIYVTLPGQTQYLEDFDRMVQGYQLIKGPKLL